MDLRIPGSPDVPPDVDGLTGGCCPDANGSAVGATVGAAVLLDPSLLSENVS